MAPKIEDVLETKKIRTTDDITPRDMQQVAASCDEEGTEWECHRFRMAGRAEAIWVLVLPAGGTAMVCDGAGTSVIYDAETLHEAIAAHFDD